MIDLRDILPVLASDLRASIARDAEVGRVACQGPWGLPVVSPPVTSDGRDSLEWPAIYSAAAQAGCGPFADLTVVHTHPHVPQVTLSAEDASAITGTPWLTELCAVSQDGVGCWARAPGGAPTPTQRLPWGASTTPRAHQRPRRYRT